MKEQMKKPDRPPKDSTRKRAEIYTRYPLSSVFIYNSVTILHFLLGGIGIIIGYNYLLGFLYLVFAFSQMYILMPLTVCPNCVYYSAKNAVCISGMNMISKKIANKGDVKNFPNRSKGLFSHNRIYLAALLVPVAALIPPLIVDFSLLLLVMFLAVVGLLLFRFFVIFTRIACVHCSAKYTCPNAEPTGVRDM